MMIFIARSISSNDCNDNAFRIMQMTSTRAQTEHAQSFTLYSRCWLLKAREIPSGLRQSRGNL